MGDDAPPASPSVSFGAPPSDGSAAVDTTSNPMELRLEEGAERTTSDDREAALQAGLRSSILKAGEGPVVSPRNNLTRSLSFVDQTEHARPLKEVRLYERDPKPGQPGRPGSLLGPPEEEEEENVKPLLIGVGVAIVLVRRPSCHAAAPLPSNASGTASTSGTLTPGHVGQFLIWMVTSDPG